MMIGRKVAGVLTLLSLALVAPRAQAQCCGLKRWFAPATTAYYAPVAAPYTAAYAPAGYGQVVNYMPQTCYRTVYVNAPVVTYRPMAACDVCGNATTVMRPVTTYMTQARLVPYMTYRPVVAAMPACAPAIPTAAYYAPRPMVAAPAAAAPCCGASAPATYSSGYAPAPSGYAVAAPGAMGAPPAMPPAGAPGATVRSLAPAPDQSNPQLGAPVVPGPPAQPSGQASPSDQNPFGAEQGPAKTFEEDNKESKPAEPQSRLLLPSRSEPAETNTGATRGSLDPESGDRTTALPIRQAWNVRQVSATIAAPASAAVSAQKKIDTSGWRAAAGR